MGISQETKEAMADNLVRAIRRGAEELDIRKTHWRFNMYYAGVGLTVEYAYKPDDPEENNWVPL